MGSIVGAIESVRDITESKKMENNLLNAKEMLAQTEKLAAVGRLARGAAHEIRNPLNIMSLWIQMLDKGETLTEKTREAFKIMNDQIARIVRIIDGLRTFSSLPVVEKKLRDINQLLEHVLRMLATRIKTEHVAVEISLQPDLPPVAMDALRMEQAVLHILKNALDAVKNREERRISIGTALFTMDNDNDRRVRISVSDTGQGIRPEDLLRLFDPFFTTKGPDRGTGLGLSICYGIVQDHGGKIWAVNNEQDGATFFIELPVGKTEALQQTSDEDPFL